MNSAPSILLASGSPRRHELLKQLDVSFSIAAANIDESMHEGEATEKYVLRMARKKALAGLEQTMGLMPSLGSDTIVLLNDRVLGKPESRAEAESLLQALSGQTHHVYSSVAIALSPDQVLETLNITAVTFGEMPASWIKTYCQSNEPMDKAGAYAVQGGTGQYIQRIEGSYSGVMGLPLFETAELLRKAGVLI
jgi:septum formation protein